jgi:hypothetical protein
VIPREGVERLAQGRTDYAITAFVIPREGVESNLLEFLSRLLRELR